MQIIFIPGLLCTDLAWGETNRLRQQYQCVDADVMRYASISEMADSVIRNISAENVALIGISMGGYVAIDAALKLGKRLKRLVLISTTANAVNPDTLSARQQAITLAKNNNMAAILQASNGMCFYSPNEYYLDIEQNMAARIGCAAYIRQQQAIISRESYMEKISQLKCSTLIMSGRNDRIIPVNDQIEMFKQIPQGNLSIFSECGHLPTLEKSSEAASIIELFLQ